MYSVLYLVHNLHFDTYICRLASQILSGVNTPDQSDYTGKLTENHCVIYKTFMEHKAYFKHLNNWTK